MKKLIWNNYIKFPTSGKDIIPEVSEVQVPEQS